MSVNAIFRNTLTKTFRAVILLVDHLAMERVSKQFGDAVSRVLLERKASLRGQRRLTGIDHATMSDMKAGVIPRMDKVIDFARGLGLDVNEWLALANYEPIWDADREFNEQLREIIEEFGGEVLLEADDLQLRGKTPEQVRAMANAVKERNRALGRGKSAEPAPRIGSGGIGPGGRGGSLLLAARAY